MPKAQADEFVEKLFGDDAFVEEAVRKSGGLPNDGNKNNKNIVKLGKAVGYDFSEEELNAALEEYSKGKGFSGLRKLIHTVRLMAKVNKRVLKEAGK